MIVLPPYSVIMGCALEMASLNNNDLIPLFLLLCTYRFLRTVLSNKICGVAAGTARDHTCVAGVNVQPFCVDSLYNTFGNTKTCTEIVFKLLSLPLSLNLSKIMAT
jgi:hypothetical protein